MSASILRAFLLCCQHSLLRQHSLTCASHQQFRFLEHANPSLGATPDRRTSVEDATYPQGKFSDGDARSGQSVLTP
jgi:hypothetical protein